MKGRVVRPNRRAFLRRKTFLAIGVVSVSTFLVGGLTLQTSSASTAPNLKDAAAIVSNQFTYGWSPIPGEIPPSGSNGTNSATEYGFALHRAEAEGKSIGAPSSTANALQTTGSAIEEYQNFYLTTPRIAVRVMRQGVDGTTGDPVVSVLTRPDEKRKDGSVAKGATSYTFSYFDVNQVKQPYNNALEIFSKFSSYTVVVRDKEVLYQVDALGKAIAIALDERSRSEVIISERYATFGGTYLQVHESNNGANNAIKFWLADYPQADAQDRKGTRESKLCAKAMMVEYVYKALQESHCYQQEGFRVCANASAASTNFRDLGYNVCASLGQV